MIKILFLIILIAGIGAGVYLVGHNLTLFPKASSDNFQDKIIISNISSNSFTVSYFTKVPTYDYLQYGTDTTVKNAVYDSRNDPWDTKKMSTHYFLINNLLPNTKYLFKINSDGVYYPTDSYLTQKTPGRLPNGTNIEIYTGAIKSNLSDDPPEEALVFLSTVNGQLLSGTADKEGKFFIGYRGMRNASLSARYNIGDADIINFFVYGGVDGFNLFPLLGLKHTNINIKLVSTLTKVPFYKLNIGDASSSAQASVSSSLTPTSSPSSSAGGNNMWVTVSNFLKL